jgi:hypothetical protein
MLFNSQREWIFGWLGELNCEKMLLKNDMKVDL